MITAIEAAKITTEILEIKRLEKEKEEIERRAQEEEERRRKEQELRETNQRTIEFCEKEITPMINAAALEGKNYIELYFGGYHCDKEKNYIIKPDGLYYANGDKSWDFDSQKKLNQQFLRTYLYEHGYKNRRSPFVYKTYWAGAYDGIKLYIEW